MKPDSLPHAETHPPPAPLDPEVCYRAVRGRDARFDGRFFTCVTSTGIFCRPICPARTPAKENCQFVRGAAEALARGFRPCLRCRPETVPGMGVWLGTEATVNRAMRLIAEGALDGEPGSEGTISPIEALADRLGLGERHLRRLFARHLGVAPGAVLRARRLLLAKTLLTESDLPLTEVALAAGFGGPRRFQAAIRETYGRAPGDLRRAKGTRSDTDMGDRAARLTLRLGVVEPHDWEGLRAFLALRAVPGVERITGTGAYERSLALGETRGWARLSKGGPGVVTAVLALNRWDDLSAVLARLQGMVDATADPAAINAVLGQDPLLAERVAARPGLRVPGAWDPFELAVRAVLGQQVSVAGARTLAGRLVEALGDPLTVPIPDESAPSRLFPTPEALAGADLSGLGLTTGRARTLTHLARAVVADPRLLDPGMDPDRARDRLEALPGIGPWTAHYIAMRAFHDPDAFPKGDLGLLRALEGAGPWGAGRPTIPQLQERAEAWRPWRAYAALHLWSGE